MFKEDYFWNPPAFSCENGKYLAIDDSVTGCFCVLLVFLSIAIALLIAVSTYCYPIKYKAKQKHLLPYYVTHEKLKEIFFNKCIINLESNDELKEIDKKTCGCYYFDDIIKLKGFNLDNILIDEKS